MFENKQKGWHGAYSRIGKNSAEQFTEIMKKDEIFNRLFKTIKVKDFFSPDKEINKLDYLEDNIKVFQVYQNELKGFSKDNNNVIDYFKSKKLNLETENNAEVPDPKTNKLKYHDIHIYNDKKRKLKRISSIPTFSYYPKYDLVFTKTAWGPYWKKMKGRKYPKITIDERDYLYDEKYSFFNEKGQFKCRVNMDKYTQRGEFIDLKDIRIRSDKGYVNNKSNNKKTKIKLNLFKNLENIKVKPLDKRKINFNTISTAKISESQTQMQNNDSPLLSRENSTKIIEKSQNSNLSSNKRKTLSFFRNRNYKSTKNLKNKTISLTNNNLNINDNQERILKSYVSSPKIKGPDFKKNITRKYLDKLRTLHLTTFLISHFSPNYTAVMEKFGSNVKYIDEKHKNRNKNKIFIGMEPNFNYDANKDLDKYNNHINTKVPNFKLMTSRYSKKGNNDLPCYMQNIYQRGNQHNINEKMLELNMYSNRDLRPSKSTFFPKKSFNNIINLNLINSAMFKNKIKSDEVKEKINMIKNEINFNFKDYKQLIKEGALNRFDGVTYKSNPRKNDFNMNNILYKENNIKFQST